MADIPAGGRDEEVRRRFLYRNAGERERRPFGQGAVPDPRRARDALAEHREREHRAQHLALERRAEVGVDAVAGPHHAAQVEEVDRVAGRERRRDPPRVPEERVAVPEAAGDHVAGVGMAIPPAWV